MKNKNGNVAVIAIIIVIVAITASVITWFVATKSQAPVQQAVVTQSTGSVAQTQSAVQSKTPLEPVVPENKDTEWKLISGKSDDSCTGIVYEGNTTIKGWYVWEKGYVENEWMLKISDSDANKLPTPKAIATFPRFNQVVKLIDASPELQKELKVATKDNPKEITLKGYYLFCEGAPSVSISPATESFKKYIKK